ncbi:phage major capsid protein [Pseudonocardia tropica]|uniref:Phage major capsid protein n=1 Tax=Pseudonocardia tropica TaxID=681289 RepID=A0ABV1JW09_9PSEU
MNPYLKAKLERYQTLRSSIEEIQTRAGNEARDLTPDEVRTINERTEEGRGLYDELAPEIEAHERSAKVATLSGELAQGEPRQTLDGRLVHAEDAMPPMAPRLMPTHEQIVELHRAVAEQRPLRLTVADRPRGGGEHERAAVTVDDTADVNVALVPRETREPRRLAVAARLGVQRVQGVTDVVYPVFNAGAADVAAEATKKPEYDAITPGLSTPQVIAVHTDATRQALESVSALEVRLRQKHAALIAKREDLLLVQTVLATTGIGSITGAAASTPFADTLLAAAAVVLGSDVGAAPNLAAINPADVVAVFGGAVGASGESPESRLRLDLHGMDVYVTPAVAAGTAVVGAWEAAARFVVGWDPRVLVDPYSQMKNNIVTTLTEEAVALAVDEPTGFVKVKFKP